MPILPPDVFVNPADLLLSNRISFPNNEWWVLHTRPRAEKSLARQLYSKGVAYFLPVHTSFRITKGRNLTSYLPLFPSYLFLYGNESARLTALATNQIVSCLSVPDQLQLHEDLRRVYLLVSSETTIFSEECVPAGVPIEIISGPFTGMRGKLLHRGKGLRFIVEVEFIRRAVSIEVGRDMFCLVD